MIKTLSVAFLLLFITNTSFSQDAVADTSKGAHYLGLNAGFTTGVGFSYKYVKNRIGFQFSGIPIVNDGDLWTSAGIAFTVRSKKSLTSGKKYAPLLYFGAHTILESQEQYCYYDWSTGAEVSNEKITDFSLVSGAIGFGFDYKLNENFLFNFMTGYGLYYTGSFSTNLSGEIGLHYKM